MTVPGGGVFPPRSSFDHVTVHVRLRGLTKYVTLGRPPRGPLGLFGADEIMVDEQAQPHADMLALG